MGNGLKYHVPRFQRDYSWEGEQWEDLWEDAVQKNAAQTSPPAMWPLGEAVKSQGIQNTSAFGGSHYMGYLVLKSSDSKNFTVIDGQQRLTTLSLLILAALQHLKSFSEGASKPGESPSSEERQKNSARLRALQNSFIGFADPVTLQMEHKLNLNRSSGSFFKNYLCRLQDPPVRNISRPERLMGKAMKYFHGKIRKYLAENIQGEGLDLRGREIARLIESLADRLFFTIITIGSEAKAYTIFETLNARGVKLSAPDLVKNHIFQTIDADGSLHDEAIRNLESEWNEVTRQLGRHRFSHFIRVDWNSRNEFSRESDLFKNIQKKARSPESAMKYLADLKASAQIYAAFQDETDSFWRECMDGVYNKPGLKASLQLLNLFHIRQPQSMLLAGFRELSPEKFARLLNSIEALSVRYNIICGNSTGEQERAYSRAAGALLRGRPFDSAMEILRGICPSDGEAAAAFAEKSFRTAPGDKKARYFLCRIEKSLRGGGTLPSF